jgi:hypothetical protein
MINVLTAVNKINLEIFFKTISARIVIYNVFNASKIYYIIFSK